MFPKIGYPHWWEDNPRNKLRRNYGNANRGSSTTSVCSMKGKTSVMNHVNHVLTNNNGGSSVFGMTANVSHTTLTDADRVGISDLSDDQWKTLITMLLNKNLLPTRVLPVSSFSNLGSLIQVPQIT